MYEQVFCYSLFKAAIYNEQGLVRPSGEEQHARLVLKIPWVCFFNKKEKPSLRTQSIQPFMIWNSTPVYKFCQILHKVSDIFNPDDNVMRNVAQQGFMVYISYKHSGSTVSKH